MIYNERIHNSSDYANPTLGATRNAREVIDSQNQKKLTKKEKAGLFLASIATASVGLLMVQSAGETVDAAKAEEVSQSVKASEELRTIDVKSGDTVSSITAEEVKIIAEDGIAPHVATDAAIDYVLGMPENKDVLKDGVLGKDEELDVPAKIKVELVNGKTTPDASSAEIQ